MITFAICRLTYWYMLFWKFSYRKFFNNSVKILKFWSILFPIFTSLTMVPDNSFCNMLTPPTLHQHTPNLLSRLGIRFCVWHPPLQQCFARPRAHDYNLAPLVLGSLFVLAITNSRLRRSWLWLEKKKISEVSLTKTDMHTPHIYNRVWNCFKIL